MLRFSNVPEKELTVEIGEVDSVHIDDRKIPTTHESLYIQKKMYRLIINRYSHQNYS